MCGLQSCAARLRNLYVLWCGNGPSDFLVDISEPLAMPDNSCVLCNARSAIAVGRADTIGDRQAETASAAAFRNFLTEVSQCRPRELEIPGLGSRSGGNRVWMEALRLKVFGCNGQFKSASAVHQMR